MPNHRNGFLVNKLKRTSRIYELKSKNTHILLSKVDLVNLSGLGSYE